MSAVQPALKFLELDSSEVEEMLSSLFRRIGYRIAGTAFFHWTLYFHLSEIKGERLVHTLACWALDKRKLSPQAASEIFSANPFKADGEANFESAILITPHDISREMREQFKPTGIEIVDGSSLVELLNKFEVPYRIPTFWDTFGKRYGRRLSYVLTLAFLLLAFFLYKILVGGAPASTQGSLAAASPSATPSSPAPATHANTPTPSSPAAAPSTPPTPQPAQAAPPVKRDVVPASQPKQSKPPAKARPAAAKARQVAARKTAPRSGAPKQKKAAAATRSSVKHARHRLAAARRSAPSRPRHKKSFPKRKEASYESLQRIEGRVARHYADVFALDEKYYDMALDFQHRKLYSLAREYYEKYLQISPSGFHAAAAKEALQKLPAK